MNEKLRSSMQASVERGFELAWNGAGVLAVLARQSGDLEHWGRTFARRVRSHHGAALEIYMPAARESLIERFNQSLAGLSIETARAEPPPAAGRRIILVPDWAAMDSPEGMLLARLVSDFPGAATRLVVLVDFDPLGRAQRFLEALGRGVQRLDLDATHAPDRLPGSDPGFSLPAQQGASDGQPTPDREPARDRTLPQDEPTVSQTRAKAESIDPERQVAMLPVANHSGGPGGRAMRWLGVGALLMALLLVSVLIVVLLHRQTGPGASSDRWPVVERGKAASNFTNPVGMASRRPSDGA